MPQFERRNVAKILCACYVHAQFTRPSSDVVINILQRVSISVWLLPRAIKCVLCFIMLWIMFYYGNKLCLALQGVPKKILLKLIFEFLTLGWVFSGVVFHKKFFLFYKSNKVTPVPKCETQNWTKVTFFWDTL